MAIRDCVTIRTRDGQAQTLEVTRQGGTIEAPSTLPRTGAYKAELLNKNGEPLGESVQVPVDNISSIVFYQAEKKARKTKG